MNYRILMLTACFGLVVSTGVAGAGDWMFQPGPYSHDPYSGVRVTQYAPTPPAYYRYSNDYAVSGYRHTDSTIRVGSSVDRTHFVETWGGGGLAFASAWMWRGFNEDFVYPNDLHRGRFDHRHRGYGHGGYGHGGYGHGGYGYGAVPYGGGPYGGYYNRGYDTGNYFGNSGMMSFDRDGATIGWDNYGGGWASGFEQGIQPRGFRRGR